MKKLTVFSLSMSILMGASVAWSQVEYDYATVVESLPIVQIVEVSTPQQQCWEEEYVVDRSYPRQGSRTPLLLSTIIGGAIGNAVGHNKSNQRVGAVVGAVLGHSIGRDIMQRQQGPVVGAVETVERCQTVYDRHEEERIVGYRVTYNYNGRDYTIRTDSDPGDQIRVRVNVQPVL